MEGKQEFFFGLAPGSRELKLDLSANGVDEVAATPAFNTVMRKLQESKGAGGRGFPAVVPSSAWRKLADAV